MADNTTEDSLHAGNAFVLDCCRVVIVPDEEDVFERDIHHSEEDDSQYYLNDNCDCCGERRPVLINLEPTF